MFAATKGVAAPQLRTVTFTSSATWVAPAATRSIITAAGYGSPGESDTYYPTLAVSGAGAITTDSVGGANPPYGQWSDLYALAVANGNTIATNSGLNKRSFTSLYYFVGPDDRYNVLNLPYEYWITGNTYSIVGNIGSPQTSGDVLYSGGSGIWQVFTSGYVLGNPGVATGAFGLTFPGGTLTGTEPFRTANPVSTTTYSGISVTPGASYSIAVPPGGSLTITYIG